MEHYKKAYEHLYKAVYESTRKKYKETNLSPFIAMKGKNYDRLKDDSSDSNIRLMLVGRATNGWGQFVDCSSKHSFTETAANLFMSSIRFETEWKMEATSTNPYSKYESATKIDANGNPIIEKYYLSRSAFWSSAAEVWCKLNHISNCPNWYDNIVWNNMYKVAPYENGNPSTNLIYTQAPSCVEILKEEIRLLNPTHILMVIDKSWISWSSYDKIMFDFMNSFENILPVPGTIENNQDIVQDAFLSNKRKVIITCRPETISRSKYSNAVIETFSKM